MTFIYCMSFGTLQEKQTIVDFMTRMHSQVSGNLAEGGRQGQEVQRPRSAPADRIWGKISDEEEMDNIYFEYPMITCALQVPETWSASRAAFWEYWDEKMATIEVT
ncbi:hypothetical protein F4824DRAFT_505356 [Ustulina deusta]|nr:hypothetical protein F4824DRAFT_505356 [Ustulina deusta]